MFTIEEIKAAHSKVKSGADFPAYIQDLIKLGVKNYESFVVDGHTVYYGDNDFTAQSPAKYGVRTIAEITDQTRFQRELKNHQQGKTNYLEFCRICGETGVEKWVVSMSEMTCIYYNKAGKEILSELIPS